MEVSVKNFRITKILACVSLLTLCCSTMVAPVPVSPKEGAVVLSSTPEFVWESVPNARSYHVEISRSQNFTEAIDTIIFSDTSFVVGDTLELGTKYYWRVSAKSTQGEESAPSAPAEFITKEGVEILTPALSDSTNVPLFSWKPYPGAQTYNFLMSPYADFSDNIIDTSISLTSLSLPDSLAPATYYWRVQAFSAGNPVSSPSQTRRIVGYRLKETYFPFELGMSFTYQYSYGAGELVLPGPIYDTSIWQIKTLVVSVEDTFTEKSRLYWVLSDTFWDIGDTVSVKEDSLFSLVYFLSKLYPDSGSKAFTTWHKSSYDLAFISDTLLISYVTGSREGAFYDSIRIERLKGKGAVRQLRYTERLDGGTGKHYWEVSLFELQD
jgi:hypothetical protein